VELTGFCHRDLYPRIPTSTNDNVLYHTLLQENQKKTFLSGGRMAEGANAVRAALLSEFGTVEIHEGFDSNTKDALLDFSAGGRDFRVRVTHEYDTDFASGQLRVSLARLGDALRASGKGEASVMTTGIKSLG
jgi:hypothetical protein